LNNSHSEDDGGPVGKKRKMNNHIHEDGNGEVVATHGTRVLALPSGPVTVNPTISKLFEAVKPQIRQLVEISNLVSDHLISTTLGTVYGAFGRRIMI
jgi:hypothetical protein